MPSEGARMAETTTPKRRSRGHSTRASVGEGLGVHIGLWERSLRAANRSARTVQIYRESIRQLEGFLEASGLPTAPSALRREHIEAWIGDLLARCKPAHAGLPIRQTRRPSPSSATSGNGPAAPMFPPRRRAPCGSGSTVR
jgi:hypothetical protein